MSEFTVISFPLNLDSYCPELNVFEDVSPKYANNIIFLCRVLELDLKMKPH
jgi:hypothetical protein